MSTPTSTRIDTEISTALEPFGPAPKSAKLPKKKWDVGKALKMRLEGEKYEKIAEEVGIPWKTVQSRLRSFLDIDMVKSDLTAFKEKEAELIDGTRALVLVQLRKCLADPTRADCIHPQSLAWIYGVLYDKQRLERGESTHNLSMFTTIVESVHKPAKEVVLEAEVVPESESKK